MTDEDLAERDHALVRQMTAKLIEQYTTGGVLPVDAAIGVLYAGLDQASAMHNGDMHSAIEWMRTLFDLIERQLLASAARKQ